MIAVFLAALTVLIPITNPLGAAAVFAGLTSDMDPKEAHRQAWRTGIFVAGILIVFAIVGTFMLSCLGIGLPALQVVGGLVVMGFLTLAIGVELAAHEVLAFVRD